MKSSSRIRNTKFAIAFSWLLSAGILIYLALRIDWRLLRAELQGMDLRFIPLMVAGFLAISLMRAYRWRFLLPETDVSIRTLFEAVLMGQLASFTLPLRAGEVVRPWFLSRHGQLAFSAALASIVTERVFDLFALLVFLAYCLFKIEDKLPFLVEAGWMMGSLTGACVAVLLLATYRSSWLLAGLRLLPRAFGRDRDHHLFQRVEQIAVSFLHGLCAINSIRRLVLIVVLSLAMWGLMATWFQLGLIMLSEPSALLPGILVCVVVSFAVAAPSAPGFLGTYQAGCVLALYGILGYKMEMAVAYSVVTHTLQLLVVLASGLSVLHLRGWSVAEFKNAK